MRVLIVTQVFYPEYFKTSELAAFLAKRGHQVEVLTSIPNYPEGVYFDGWGILKKRVEFHDGYKIYRAFQSPRGRKASAIGLSLYYLSFAFCATMWVMFYFAFKRKYDAVVAFQTSPITQTIPAVILKKLRHCPVYTWVQDVWPDTVLATLHTDNSIIKKGLGAVTDWVYRNSRHILISSPDFKGLVCRNADYTDRIEDYPNWSEDIKMQPIIETPALPEGFRIMMAGNIGIAQDIENVANCILLLREYSDIKWIFVGGGSKLDWLRNFVGENHLDNNVYILGRFPFQMMHSLYAQADAMLLTLQKSEWPHLNATIPSRVQSYMSSGKPIVGMIGSGAASLIHKANAGRLARAGDYKALSDIILDLKNKPELLSQMGEDGRKYYESHYTPQVCIEHLENLLRKDIV